MGIQKCFLRLLRVILIVALTSMAFFTTYHKIPDWTQKQHRFLLMMTSFKRPIFATGQIYRLMNQTYQNFDLSVSLKGIDEKYSRLTFEKEMWPYIDAKRLFIRYDDNKDQLSNMLDPIRDIDINQYDYFCKVDDDDWYAPEYIENMNDELNDALKKGKTIDLSLPIGAYILRDELYSTNIYYYDYIYPGPIMCFSRFIISMALDIENDKDLFEKMTLIPENDRYDHEDNVIKQLAQNWGTIQNRNEVDVLVMIGQQYPSVMRNKNYVDFHGSPPRSKSFKKPKTRKLGYDL